MIRVVDTQVLISVKEEELTGIFRFQGEKYVAAKAHKNTDISLVSSNV